MGNDSLVLTEYSSTLPVGNGVTRAWVSVDKNGVPSVGINLSAEALQIWLAENVFNENEHELIIAGRNPSPILQNAISKFRNIELIINPSTDEMSFLIKNAHSFSIT